MSTRSTNAGIITGSAKQTATVAFAAHLVFLVAILLMVLLAAVHRLIAVDGGVMVLSAAALFVAWCLYAGVRQWLDRVVEPIVSIARAVVLPFVSTLKSAAKQSIRLWHFIEAEAIGPFDGEGHVVAVVEATQQRLGSLAAWFTRTFGTPDPEVEDQDFS